ncbi:hypothetical protein M0R04_07895 [Candidatus Dojkabacteria bacterium]|nr:hypothetical protein [Candidatus Dojkabacteria bacterium]
MLPVTTTIDGNSLASLDFSNMLGLHVSTPTGFAKLEIDDNDSVTIGMNQ